AALLCAEHACSLLTHCNAGADAGDLSLCAQTCRPRTRRASRGQGTGQRFAGTRRPGYPPRLGRRRRTAIPQLFGDRRWLASSLTPAETAIEFSDIRRGISLDLREFLPAGGGEDAG